VPIFLLPFQNKLIISYAKRAPGITNENAMTPKRCQPIKEINAAAISQNTTKRTLFEDNDDNPVKTPHTIIRNESTKSDIVAKQQPSLSVSINVDYIEIPKTSSADSDGNKSRSTEHSLSSQMSTIDLEEEEVGKISTVDEEFEATVLCEATIQNLSHVTRRSGITIESSSVEGSFDQSDEEKKSPTPKNKKIKIIVISDTDSDDEEPSLQEISQLFDQTVAQNLNRYFERYSCEKYPQNQPDNVDHAKKMDKSNEKEKTNGMLEEKDEVSATDEESFNQPNVHKLQEHVEIIESSAEEDEQRTPVPFATTEPNTDLIPSVMDVEVLNTPVNKIQVQLRRGSTTSESTTANTSSDSDDDGKLNVLKMKGTKVRHPPKSRRRTFNASLAKTPVPSTKRRNTPQLTGSRSSKVHKERNPTNTMFEKSDEEEIIDEDMEAMLDEVYGNEWRTPALLKTCVSVRKLMPNRNVTTDPGFRSCKY
jgi:hypothetical protein